MLAEQLEMLAAAMDPSLMMGAAGYEPDGWQSDVLRSDARRVLLLCARQLGKSTCVAAKALHTALFDGGALVLLISPSLRQSSELYRKVLTINDAIGRPVGASQESATSLALENGSRVVCLPGNPATVRGFSA